jgi:NhaA family Na+:H+ antiporter
VNAETLPNRLARPVDEADDHALGPADAEFTLVEYGSYADAPSHAAREHIAELRNRYGDRLRYVFRHRPLPVRRAAEPVESYDDPSRFWNVHVALMGRSDKLTEEDLLDFAADSTPDSNNPIAGGDADTERAKARVDADTGSTEATRTTEVGAQRRFSGFSSRANQHFLVVGIGHLRDVYR